MFDTIDCFKYQVLQAIEWIINSVYLADNKP